MEKYQMERRVMRGAIIAQKSRLKKALDGWHVPSQTRHIYYRVVFEGFRSEPKCTCPDYEFFKEKCKHIYAVEFTLRREVDKDGNLTVTKSIRLSYPQNWPAYDKAQANEKENFMNLLGDLCGYIPEPEQASGRPMLSMRDMTFASALKVYSTFSLRRFMTYLREAKEDGHIGKVPSFASVGHFMQRKDVTPVLMELVEKSSLPLRSVETQFAMDSSGFSTSRFGRWYDFRHGSDKTKRVWFKAHVMVGVKTNVVTSLVMSDGYGNDGKHFPELMEKTAENFSVKEVSADKAYLSLKNLRLAEELGAVPFIPFKKNNNADGFKPRIWKRLYHYFLYRHEEFSQHYHKRSNVETTFHMIKSKFGGSLRSKTETAQLNEVLLKILCHNICVVNQEVEELKITV